jgi:hypothetical protein
MESMLEFKLEFGSGNRAVYNVIFKKTNLQIGQVFEEGYEWLYQQELRVGACYNSRMLCEITEFMKPLQEESDKRFVESVNNFNP